MTFIYPNWPVPKTVHSLSTTRQGGVSLPPYDSLNLGDHVGDDKLHVKLNRDKLIHSAALPQQPVWLNQIHSDTVINLNNLERVDPISADASYTSQKGQVCAVMTADCLPILFCSVKGDEVAAAHAGWRGLCHGVIENTVKQFSCSPEHILAWLGPAIGPQQFEVGIEVKEQFEAVDKDAALAFHLSDSSNQKYLANIYLLAQQRLHAMGVMQIYGGEHCTVSEPDTFFSFRRDNVTGRMASIIWLQS